MDDLLHLGRILLQDTNGATADDECARSADDQVRLQTALAAALRTDGHAC